MRTMKKAVFGLEPLSCPTCIKKIEGTLLKLNGIEEVKVMFHSNRVRIQFNENIIQADEAQKVIEKLGYPVVSQRVS